MGFTVPGRGAMGSGAAERIIAFKDEANDLALPVLYFNFGRYLLIIRLVLRLAEEPHAVDWRPHLT